MDVEEFLAHHGVKGQKWGVRKERPQTKVQKFLGTNRPKGQKLTNEQKDARGLVAVGSYAALYGGAVGVQRGQIFLKSHPEIIGRPTSFIKGRLNKQAAITTPKVLKFIVKNGVYVLK